GEGRDARLRRSSRSPFIPIFGHHDLAIESLDDRAAMCSRGPSSESVAGGGRTSPDLAAAAENKDCCRQNRVHGRLLYRRKDILRNVDPLRDDAGPVAVVAAPEIDEQIELGDADDDLAAVAGCEERAHVAAVARILGAPPEISIMKCQKIVER